LARPLLNLAATVRSVLGIKAMSQFTKLLRQISGNSIPQWNSWLPKASSKPKSPHGIRAQDKVIYFPTCVSRLFGCSAESPYRDSQNARIEGLLNKAGFEVVYPQKLSNLCCGMAFSSKGFNEQADKKSDELFQQLAEISQNGKYPILIDTSPCAQRLKTCGTENSNLPLYDITDFLLEFVVPRVRLQKLVEPVALHIPCSLRKSGQEKRLLDLAKMCAEIVQVPDSTPCCGFAGDRGFSHPELTASALVTLKPSLSPECQVGYSTSRTCEIGVSLHSGISYQSIAYLVDEAAQTK
ncbi:MAG TPA: (Fe-S)-binding protein, partial [Terriglobales bacterium]|nr:(Fe-S)-binding protein [Terriglobales bacterium]